MFEERAAARHEVLFVMMTEIVLRVHRWASLILAPLFTVILLSGGLLALEPILGKGESRPRGAVDVVALMTVLEQSQIVQQARTIEVDPDGATVTFEFKRVTPDVRLDIATGAILSEPKQSGFFAVLHDLHEGLLLDGKFVVEIAAWVMLAVLFTGPFLAWPHLRNTLSGWHIGIGWILFPLVLLPSATATLRTLGVGRTEVPKVVVASPPLKMADAFTRAAKTIDLSRLDSMRRLDGGALLLTTAPASGAKAWLVKANEVQAVTAPRNWMKDLHGGVWAAPYSGWIALVSASALLGLLGTGSIAWTRRRLVGRLRHGDNNADLLVAHASQTSTAARYAEATAAALREGGARVAVASLAAIRPEDLLRYRAVLLLVSTTGEGQVAEPGRAFLHALGVVDLGGARFALLALGDSHYRAFCAGGETMGVALIQAGAVEFVPITRADGDPAAAWQAWLAAVSAPLSLHLQGAAQPEADRSVKLRLTRRKRLDDPTRGDTREVHAVEFESATPLDWRPGDLLLISPGEEQPERCYSIGSTSRADDRHLMLTVALRQSVVEDGTLKTGAASGLLCHDLPVGATIHARLRRHPAFNPPEDPQRAIIMLATGCGIAPFIGFLADREAAGSHGASWLLFGNRHRAADFLHGEQLERWAHDGVLGRLDTAFSRDAGDGSYIQDLILRNDAEVWIWLEQRNAILYACGGQATLGQALDDALQQVAMAGGKSSPEVAAATVGRWRAEGRIRCDLID